MKEIEIPALDKIESLTEEVEKIKQDCKLQRFATRQSLAELYELMKNEILIEDDIERATEEPLPVD